MRSSWSALPMTGPRTRVRVPAGRTVLRLKPAAATPTRHHSIDDDLKLAGRGGRHGTILFSTRSQCDASAVRRITEGFYLQTYLIPRHRRGSIHSSRRVLICVATNVSSACGPCVAAALAALMSAPPSARLSVSTSLAPRRGVGVGAGVVAGVDASTGGIWSLVESSPLAPGGRS